MLTFPRAALKADFMPASSLPGDRPLRVLFLCTGNSARSQLAEAALTRNEHGRFIAESLGSRPADRITVAALRNHGNDGVGHPPRGLNDVLEQRWSSDITVCGRAKESCPIRPGQPVLSHWGIPDPAEAGGRRKKGAELSTMCFAAPNFRIDLLVSRPLEKLERLAVGQQVRAIGQAQADLPLPTT